jgi:tRNA(Ile)-lysidine synthetase-like protein
MDSIYNLWFPEGSKYQRWWFRGMNSPNGKDDESIRRIETLIEELPVDDYNWRGSSFSCLCGILAYDQLFRHIGEVSNRTVSKAMDLAYYALQKNWFASYEPHELVFALLPFRHTGDLTHISFCEAFIGNMTASEKNNPHIRRFMNALMKQKENIIRGCGGDGGDGGDEGDEGDEGNKGVDTTSKLLYTQYYDILCDKEIYIYNPQYEVLKSNAYKVFRDFVESGCDTCNMCNGLKDGNTKFIISLSGGVDSMVCLYLALLYRRINPQFRFCAVHINWNQRSESKKEMEFLVNWSWNNNVELITRNYYGLSRSKNRAVFERESRALRFDFYKEVMSRDEIPGVVFMGHHRGDIVENVFTNMIRGVSFLDLGKMKTVKVVDGVTLVRPFLSIPKDDILDVARNSMLPFFKDTTPDWSNRGAVRRRIFPEIQNQFGKSYETGFLRMADKSSQIGWLVHKCVIQPYIQQIRVVEEKGAMDGHGTIELIMPIRYDYPLVFYEMVFEQICHSRGVVRMSNRSLKHWYKLCMNVGSVGGESKPSRDWSCSFGENMRLEYLGAIAGCGGEGESEGDSKKEQDEQEYMIFKIDLGVKDN